MSALTTSRIARGAVVAVIAGGTVAGAVSLSAAAPAATSHTLTFNASQVADHIIGFQDIAADVDKQNGKVVGYDTTDCHMNTQTKTAHCEVTLARANGTMRGWIHLDLNSGLATGTVTGGTRAYHGVTGTISGKAVSNNATAVTIRYHS
ncbi:MAG TPA: hypothetical protein VHC43_03595 [Mycobacteriales bacterium]|nr:hypothetical protein [Mycobacteriales bacterium]